MRTRVHENIKRSVVKALTFRAFILISDSMIIFTITHKLNETFGVILFSNLASTIVYLIHERIWNTIHWGRSHRKR